MKFSSVQRPDGTEFMMPIPESNEEFSQATELALQLSMDDLLLVPATVMEEWQKYKDIADNRNDYLWVKITPNMAIWPEDQKII